MRIREMIDALKKDALARLCERRQLKRSGSRPDLLERLARSYRGDFSLVIADLRAVDLRRVLGTEFALGELVFEFTNLHRAPQDELQRIAHLFFATDWAPDADGPIQGDSLVGVRILEDAVQDEGLDEDEAEDFDDDEFEDDEEQEAEEEERSEGAPAWREHLHFELGGARRVPDGLVTVEKPLVEYQLQSVAKLADWLAAQGPQGGVLCLPTGAGKTRVAVTFVLQKALPRRRVLWLTHRHELVNQTIAAFAENSANAPSPFTVSRFEAGARKHDEATDIVVASIPTLAHRREGRRRNLQKLLRVHRSFDLVILDECHHGVARTWKKLIKHFRDKKCRILGLSATPTRTSEREVPEFWKLFDDIIHEEAPLKLIQRGVLAKPIAVPVATHFRFAADDAERRHFQRFQDLPASLVNRIANHGKRNDLIVERFLSDRAQWGQTLLFAANVEHARELTAKLRKAGARADYLVSGAELTPDRRRTVVQTFRDKKIEVLVNVGLFTEGTDLPAVESVFIARPTRSHILFRQMVGRGMRGLLFGGTRNVFVVPFFDHLENLIDAQFSTFQSERDLLGALDLDASSAAVARTGDVADQLEGEVEGLRDDDTSRRRARDLVDEVLASLERHLLAVPSGTADWSLPAESPLVGWYELDTARGRVYLAVFREDQSLLAGRVAVLESLIRAGTTPAPDHEWAAASWTTEEQWTRIAEASCRTRTAPRFVWLEDSHPLEATTAVESLLTREGATPPDVTVADAVTSWHELARLRLDQPGPDGDRVVLVAGGRSHVVTKRNYDAIRGAWERARAKLGDNPDAEKLDFFVGMVTMLPGLEEIPEELLRAVLGSAARTGALPRHEPLTALRPPLSAVASELRALKDRDARKRAAHAIHEAFLKRDYGEFDDFVIELACGS